MNKMQTLLTTIVLLFGINSTGFTSSNDRLENLFKENIVKAKQGDADAQLNLGVMYANGKGVLKDDKQATKWYQKAADQGNASAQYNLGVRYENGKGVLKDDKQAVKWYQKAADQGNASAQYNLGAMYADSTVVLKDLSKAKYWIKKAYENPDASASALELAEKAWNQLELWKY